MANVTGTLAHISNNLSAIELSINIFVSIGIGAFTLFLITYYCLSRKVKVQIVHEGLRIPRLSVSTRPTKPRFRKRDKVLFYGRKVLRKVKNTVAEEHHKRARTVINKLAKRLLKPHQSKEHEILNLQRPPPSFFGDDDFSQVGPNSDSSGVPPELLYLLRSVRVLGHFEKPLFLELCRHVKTISLLASQKIEYLHPDIYIVQSGKLRILITDTDGCEHSVKDTEPGQSVHSLLSLLDALLGHTVTAKINVSAVAITDTIVFHIPASAFADILMGFPESLVRVVQVMMLRLQRVTYGVLHNQLALTAELTQNDQAVSHDLEEERKKNKKMSLRRTSHPPEATPSDFEVAMETARVESIQGPASPSKVRSRSHHPIHSQSITPQTAEMHMARVLGVDDENLLAGRVHIRKIQPGEELLRQGETDCFLGVVLVGTLHVLQKEPDSGNEIHIHYLRTGELIGSLAVLTGEPSLFTIRNKLHTENEVLVGVLLKAHFYSIMRERPKVVLHSALAVARRMSSFVRHIDFALDWDCIESGHRLFASGDPADSIYLILSGRLRGVTEKKHGESVVLGEYGRGEVVGALEVLTHHPRQSGLMAVRDTEVARVPSDLLTYIKRRYPLVVSRLIHLLGRKMFSSNPTFPSTLHHQPTNIATVAVLPAASNVPLSNFCLELEHALSAIGSTLRLTSECIQNRLGTAALDPVNYLRLASWLGQQEDNHKIVIYQCDSKMSAWTTRCIRQADVILIVALYSSTPTVGDLEMKVDNMSVRAHKELVLLHAEDSPDLPNNTAAWLNARGWCTAHHHVRCPSRVLKNYSSSKLNAIYRRLFDKSPDKLSDCSRLARLLTGTSVGLVLGGGGARGLAHVGLLKALCEAGVPIDMVGGTSIGALMGALWCLHTDVTKFTQAAREWSKSMTSKPKLLYDLTYPATALMTGSVFNTGIKSVIPEDKSIEDLWIPYFTITTDVTASVQRMHTSGSLWRYVRASMSLAGYLPPLCDPVDGHLLLDGGYVNNVPADAMKQLGAETVIAVDVGSEDNNDLANYGDELSGWWALWQRIRGSRCILNMAELQSRLAYVSCVRQLEQVKSGSMPGVHYVRPPINRYSTLQFGSFDEIFDVGYAHGKALFHTSLIDELFRREFQPFSAVSQNTISPKEEDFIDLAELISKIDEPYRVPSTASLLSLAPSESCSEDECSLIAEEERNSETDTGFHASDHADENDELRTPPEGDPSPEEMTTVTSMTGSLISTSDSTMLRQRQQRKMNGENDMVYPSIAQLSDDDLFKCLRTAGFNIGPVIETTRFVYEKKLTSYLIKEKAGDDVVINPSAVLSWCASNSSPIKEQIETSTIRQRKTSPQPSPQRSEGPDEDAQMYGEESVSFPSADLPETPSPKKPVIASPTSRKSSFATKMIIFVIVAIMVFVGLLILNMESAHSEPEF
ncbi:DgyrCDS4682 [Dimorphilus gyrociliatus]|uniref:DgyrCDS4682 n=1 Tax=Dimorphilus gyrociliatus TaxID=2664684 RepID=A0A7I8VI75_9ANNE|nr:DgyrCDS4682 [Dimorphilus gyrociliatus]